MQTIYRLEAQPDDFRSLLLGETDEWRIRKFFEIPPFLFESTWGSVSVHHNLLAGDADRPMADMASFEAAGIAFSARAVQELRSLLEPNGELLPLEYPLGQFFAYNCTNVIDALDIRHSEIIYFSKPNESEILRIEEYSFFADRIANSIIFRIPQKWDYFVSETFVDRVRCANLSGFAFDRVWCTESSPR